MNRIVGDRFPGVIEKAKEKTITFSEAYRSGEQKKATSQLYFVECTTQLIETAGDRTRPVAAKRFGTREVALFQLSFTNCDIWIALPGGGVTLEGANRSCRQGKR